MNDDNLESLLRSAGDSEPPPSNPAADLTERVLSIAAQRQNRRRRRLVSAGLVGCYLAGMLTTWLCLPSEPTNAETHVVQEQLKSSTRAAPASAIDDAAERLNERGDETTVADISDQDAPATVRTPYELFRDLGDASHARNDFESALDYYRMALDSASEADVRTVDDQDSFLLLSLKQDRIESTLGEPRGESL